MSTAQATSNKTTFSRFHDAINSGDAELISKTIDGVVEPDVLFHAPVPMDAMGRRHSSKCGRCSFAHIPTLTLPWRI